MFFPCGLSNCGIHNPYFPFMRLAVWHFPIKKLICLPSIHLRENLYVVLTSVDVIKLSSVSGQF